MHLGSSFGFGRNPVAPAVSLQAQQYPGLEIRLDLFDRVVDIVSEGFDLESRVGGVPDTVGVFRKAEGVRGIFAGAFQGLSI